LGISLNARAKNSRSFITLSGLIENLEEGLALLEHLIRHLKPDEEALENVVEDILAYRENIKLERRVILNYAMLNYAKFGPDSPYSYRLAKEDLKNLKASQMVALLQSLFSFEHKLYFYGKNSLNEVCEMLEKHHRVDTKLQAVLPEKEFLQPPTDKNRILFLNFPILQADVMLLSRSTPAFNHEEHMMRGLFNEYFGSGLSSVVFQEIRESMGLAYSAYAFYTSPRKKNRAHFLQAYLGTQPDKLTDAITALLEIFENMPLDKSPFDQARVSIIRQIESDRTLPTELYWRAKDMQERGYAYDLNRDIYKKMQKVEMEDLRIFHEKFVKSRPFTFLVLGDKSRLDMEYLASLGEIKELSLEEVFGY